MDMEKYLLLENCSSAAMSDVPVLETELFRRELLTAVGGGSHRILAFFALEEADYSNRLIAVLGAPQEHLIKITSTLVKQQFESLSAEYSAFSMFEREIAETTDLVIKNHPWLKPVRDPDKTEFFKMDGESVHEVAVGPVHAGVIEPGHFRFQCMGEDVFFLEIALGYQHRGVENLLKGNNSNRAMHLIETAAGDTSAAAAVNWSHIIESLAVIPLDPGACRVRAIAMELERIACHTGDLGALAGDVAFLPTASFCGRIRGEYLNMTAEICGNRFGRGIAVPGGSRFGIEKARAEKLLKWIRTTQKELYYALDLLFESPTVLDRFENTGAVSEGTARRLGLVGPAARACGLEMDARHDFPSGEYGGNPPLPAKCTGTGDVMARARIRYEEIRNSHDFLLRELENIAGSGVESSSVEPGDLKADHIAVSVVEAWRGELCHVAVTGMGGNFRKVKIVDPSFHNWSGLAEALRGEQISNFPVCNKSFNLSYCGHDL